MLPSIDCSFELNEVLYELASTPNSSSIVPPTPSGISEFVISPTAAYSYKKWSKEEDEKLRHAVTVFGENNWRTISDFVGTRDNSKYGYKWCDVWY